MYNPYIYPQYPQNYPQAQTQQQTQAPANEFVLVGSEIEARNYPVAYGRTVTFKNENAPYIYIKTMGFSQLEPPKFEKYKKEIEENTPRIENAPTGEIQGEINKLWNKIETLEQSLKEVKENGLNATNDGV